MKAGRLARLTTLLLGLACPLAAAEVQARVLRVRIADMVFEPSTVTAAVGDVIEWSNEDFVDHSATSAQKIFDVEIPAGRSAAATMLQRGRLSYSCRYHPNMTAVIDVR